jgi:murein DD-endopeptidase MepM/ murein hydrolase activator NlpD
MEATIAALGDDVPIISDARGGPPDKREISARWLSGTFLTGLTSTILMGVAVFIALEGRQQLATPPEIAKLDQRRDDGAGGEAARTIRPSPPPKRTQATDRKRMEISTLTRDGGRNVVRMMPFMSVRMALAAGYTTTRKYPPFDPADVAAADPGSKDAAPDQQTTLVVGYKVESDVSIETVEFPDDLAAFDETVRLSANEVEEVVRTTAAELPEGAVQVASLHYLDPQRFGADLGPGGLAANIAARILHENVSVAERSRAESERPAFAEDVIPVRAERSVANVLGDAGYRDAAMDRLVNALVTALGSKTVDPGSVLRIGIETTPEADRVVRVSVYRGGEHRLSIALDDHDQFVPTDEPERNPAVAAAFDEQPQPLKVRGELPSVYDGIYRAAFSYGMTRTMTKQMVRMFAADVDYEARISPSDRISAFFSNPDGDGNATDDSELLYVQATFSGTTRNFYRFRSQDGSIDFFDENGRSSRQFLLRKTVPNGEFRSGFGMRRHPILGYMKMHTGIDWAAPSGSPILAAGSGVVEKAGWAGGYGKQTIIRHTNGYETSYSHQSRIAPGIAPGARIRQGQVIGYVGTTGLSTGAHLHFELIVNGTKVDPMRIRLPTGKVLKGNELEAFKRERDRIDALLRDESGAPQKVAEARS